MAELFRRDHVHGIDVSRYQDGRVDYPLVAAQGVCFGWIGISQGKAHVSKAANRHAAGLADASILMSGYHFAEPTADANDAKRQARHFLSVLLNLDAAPNLRPVLDLEAGDELGRDRLTSWTLEWLGVVRDALGFWPLLYAGRYLRQLDWKRMPSDLGLWVSHYPAKDSAPFDTHVRLRDQRLDARSGPSRPTGLDWACWQWTSHGAVMGVTGRIDLNVARELKPLLAPKPVPATPTTASQAAI